MDPVRTTITRITGSPRGIFCVFRVFRGLFSWCWVPHRDFVVVSVGYLVPEKLRFRYEPATLYGFYHSAAHLVKDETLYRARKIRVTSLVIHLTWIRLADWQGARMKPILKTDLGYRLGELQES